METVCFMLVELATDVPPNFNTFIRMMNYEL